MEPILEAVQLTKRLQGAPVVDRVDLSIPAGSIYGVVGANGAGKSTLLRLFLGLFRPTSGEVRVFGESMPMEAAEIRQRVQYVGADGHLFKSFRVRDLATYGELLYERWDGDRCRRLLDALELPPRLSIRHLSFGMKMQLRLAFALSSRPDILLLDEPTTGLDVVVKKQFLQFILDEAAAHGTTIVWATHQLADLERMADGIAVMHGGRIVTSGMLEDLRNRVRCYQFLLPTGTVPPELARHEAILRMEQRGSVYTLVAADVSGEMEGLIRSVGTSVEQLDMDLEDLFTHLLYKEGYSREAILLA